MNIHKNQLNYFKKIIESNCLANAYIFTGPKGIGKVEFAINLAKSVLCEHKNLFDNKCNCSSCTLMKNNSHPDFYIFDDKENIKDDFHINIKASRKINEITYETTFFGGYKVIILNDFHLISQGKAEGANALLKTIEEPRDKTLFILITNKPQKILSTISSRSITVPFEPCTKEELRFILEKEFPEKNFSSVIDFSMGSKQMALILEEIEFQSLINSIIEGDLNKFIKYYFNSKSKEQLHYLCDGINIFLFSFLKDNFFIDYLKIKEDLDNFINRLDYNINLNIQQLDLLVKIIKVIKWNKQK